MKVLILKNFISKLTSLFTTFFFLFCFVELIHANPTFINQLKFEHITSIEGLSNNTIYNIAQDTEGFIWIATHEGLNKFNGKSIQTYYHTNSSNHIPGNFVKQLLVTSEGGIWVGTETGVSYYCKELDAFTQIKYQDNSLGDVVKMVETTTHEKLIASTQGLFIVDNSYNVTKVSNEFYRDLCEYKRGIIWAASDDEIHLINLQGEIIKRYNNISVQTNDFDFTARNIQCFYKDSRNTIWIGTMRNGLGVYKPETDEFITLKLKEVVNPIEDNFIRVINEDSNGKLWIGTESGLYIYNVDDQSFIFYGQSFNPQDKGLNDKAIYSIFRSQDNIMWVGTYFGGINFTNQIESRFVNIYADGGVKYLSGNALSEIIETSSGEIWMGTEDGGISIYQPQSGRFSYLRHQSGKTNTLTSNNVHALEEDAEGNIWIGTFIGGLNKYHLKNGKIERIELNNPVPNPVQNVFSIKIDAQKRTWVGAISGLYLKNNEADTFNLFYPEIFQNNFIYHIDQDNDGNLWICTYYNGIYKLDSELKIQNYRTSTQPEILSNQIIYFYNDSNKNIWFGTNEGGLLQYDPETDKFQSYTVSDGLPNNTVYAITEDKLGNIWFSTNKGIVSFNRVNKLFRTYNEHDGLIGNQFNYKSCFKNAGGMIYFGAVNGLTYFNPVRLPVDIYQPKIHFTDFKLFNNSVEIGDKSILHSHINYQDKIELKHKYNVFTIDFIGLNYLLPKNNEYAYYLEGFESDWNYVGNQNSATYTNLSPGKYIFHVKVSNGEHKGFAAEKLLIIKIKPPFWLSLWGMIIYFLIVFSLVYIYWNYSIQKHKSKLNLQMAEMEKEKNEAINQHRLNFFTYISHEFKTPLTIVLATIEKLLEYKEVLPQLKDYGMMIQKNAFRLLFLINQLMEFRKIETDHASIKLNKGEIVGFLKTTFDMFLPLMENKQLNGTFNSNLEKYVIYFDADKLEKIITNVLSNACNSFVKPGNISLDVKILERINHTSLSDKTELISDIILTIKDDGPGLPASKVEQVFDPFFSDKETDIHRSGIGLVLVRSLVDFMNGQIQINSAPKSGTTVTIQLPLIHHPKAEQIRNNDFIDQNTAMNTEKIVLSHDYKNPIEETFNNGNTSSDYHLLIVEDNKDLSSFLAHHFSRFFKVSTAFDGKSGLKKVEKMQPDIIISDIMMPLLDGYQLCKQVKNSIATSHIPIILLTAKSGVDSKLEGLDHGADAYIDKPFNLRELELTIRNILKSRQIIRDNFINLNVVQETVSKLNNKDQIFIEKLNEIIFKHLDDPKFNVELFCKELLVSRTLLHMKLKKITGLSTTEYIRNVRLNEAKKMLESDSFTVSEVAYRVGYSDPAYFSKTFKKLYHFSPSSLKERN